MCARVGFLFNDESRLMKNQPESHAPSADIGTHISGALHEAMRENTHDLHRVSERLADSINALASQSKHAASDLQHRLEKQTEQARTAAAHYIQESPFKSVMIAAGVGASAAALLSWWMGSRSR
jgi:ElaB/YqjD/DUF883 family membrane-anchored ribosome-binding protein